MQDTASHGALKLDIGELRHTLSVHDVEAQLDDAGVPRSRRQIIRYCQTGMLDAVKVPGPTGDQYFISPASVPKAIADLKQWEAQRVRHGAPEQDMSSTVVLNPAPKVDTDTARHGEPERAASNKEESQKGSETELVTTRYVQQLEKRIDEKDDVIGLLKGQLSAKDQQIGELSSRFTSLSDRFADTQKLMGAMQRMLAPLLGQSDPYHAPEKREVDNPHVDKGD